MSAHTGERHAGHAHLEQGAFDIGQLFGTYDGDDQFHGTFGVIDVPVKLQIRHIMTSDFTYFHSNSTKI